MHKGIVKNETAPMRQNKLETGQFEEEESILELCRWIDLLRTPHTSCSRNQFNHSPSISLQLWELTKNGQLVTKKDPKGCLYVDDNWIGEIARYDDDCSVSRKYSHWMLTGSDQIQLKDENYCLTYDAPANSMSPPDEKDKMILGYCRPRHRFQYVFEKK